MTRKISYRFCLVMTLFVGIALSLPAGARSHQAFPFLKIQKDPVRTAMGGGGYAYTSSLAYSSWSNPAALVFSADTMGISLGYQYWMPECVKTHNISFGAGWNIKQKAGITLGLTGGINPAYEITEDFDVASGTFKPRDFQVNMGLSFKLCPPLSIGVNAHYVSQELMPDNIYCLFAFDAFLMARAKDFTFTVGANSIGTAQHKIGDKHFDKKTAATTPLSVVAGIAFRHVFTGKHAIDILADADYYIHSNDFRVSGGFGFTIAGIVSLRAGYHYGGLMPQHISTGIGFNFFGVHIDAAYLIGSPVFDAPIKNTFCLSAGYSF